MLIYQIEFGTHDYWALVRLREIELRLPLGLRFSIEELSKESGELFIVLKNCDGQILATNQFAPEGNKVKIRQVATRRNDQNKGYGKRLYLGSEAILKSQGYDGIYCHARKSAIDFYRKLGFEVYSDEFIEVGIPHFKMRKNLIG